MNMNVFTLYIYTNDGTNEPEYSEVIIWPMSWRSVIFLAHHLINIYRYIAVIITLTSYTLADASAPVFCTRSTPHPNQPSSTLVRPIVSGL